MMTNRMAEKDGGTLEVGTNERGEVVINLPHDMTGHIVFSPDQARTLAATLLEMALRANEKLMGKING